MVKEKAYKSVMDQISADCKVKKKPHQIELTFHKAVHGFLGYLEGSEKSSHTVKSYRLDLAAFENFIQTHKTPLPGWLLTELTVEWILDFKTYLEQGDFKSNTRRRQLLTLHKFLTFWVKRKKLPEIFARPILVPLKVEKSPKVLDYQHLLSCIQQLAVPSYLHERNKLIAWILLETACFVSELGILRFEHLQTQGLNNWTLCIVKKDAIRVVPLSQTLYEHLMAFKALWGNQTIIFEGMGIPGTGLSGIKSRAVELIIKQIGQLIGTPELTPRLIRNTCIWEWLKNGQTLDEVQHKLGLRTQYAFKVYAPMLADLKSPNESVVEFA
jgi:site-specific recombinase XerD